jgi:hypothetical protein
MRGRLGQPENGVERRTERARHLGLVEFGGTTPGFVAHDDLVTETVGMSGLRGRSSERKSQKRPVYLVARRRRKIAGLQAPSERDTGDPAAANDVDVHATFIAGP